MYEKQASRPQSLGHAGGLGSVEAAKRLPELQAALERQERAINSASDAIAQLEMRLGPVLRSDPPQAVGHLPNQTRPSPSTQMACRIEENTDRIMTCIGQMHSFLDRLEI